MGNLLGPWILGRLFDTVGRKPMIALTYVLSGVLLVITGLFFVSGLLTAVTITACWGGDSLLRLCGRQLSLPDRE